MPLRDHFHPPVNRVMSWESIHAQWPAMLVLDLTRKLPPQFVAAPQVHSGAHIEIDVGTFEKDSWEAPRWSAAQGNGGVATAVWAPPRPTFAAETDLAAQDEYEVRVYDTERGRRLVAAIEIVSPANKDRPNHRDAFVAKCAALLQEQVSLVIVDLVTTRQFNLYGDLLELARVVDPALEPEAPHLYAAAVRSTKRDTRWLLESWMQPLAIGQPLPTLPLWLTDDFAIPLALETSYEETCQVWHLPS